MDAVDVADVKNFSVGNLILPLDIGNAPQTFRVKLFQFGDVSATPRPTFRTVKTQNGCFVTLVSIALSHDHLRGD